MLKLLVLQFAVFVQGDPLLNFGPHAMVDMTGVAFTLPEDIKQLLLANASVSVAVQRIECLSKVVFLQQGVLVERSLTELAEFDLATLVLVHFVEHLSDLVRLKVQKAAHCAYGSL